MELVADAEYHVLLQLAQVELTVYFAVHALTSLTADGDDGGICLLQFMGHTALRDFYFVELGLALVEEPHHGILVGLELGLGIAHVVLVNLRQQGSGGNTDVLQSLYHVDHVRNVDTAGTQAARHEVVAVDTKQGHCLEVANGQGCH